MNVIAEYTVPARDFALGPPAGPEVTVELDRLVENGDALVGYVWTHGDGADRFERELRDVSAAGDVERLDRVADRRLYRWRSQPEPESLLRAVHDYGAGILAARGDGEEWSFRLMFDDATALSEFQRFCVDTAGIALELTQLFNPVEGAPTVESELTKTQRETLVAAYEAGYFDIPRKVTLVDLADRLDISDQAVSERMRRGEAKLVETHLLDE